MLQRLWCTVFLTLLVGAAGACTRPDPPAKAEADADELRSDIERAAEDVSKGLEEAAKGLEKAAGQVEGATNEVNEGLERLAKGLGEIVDGTDREPVEPISFRRLQEFFPELSDWEMSRPTGEKMNSPVRYSKTSVTYRRGNQQIEATILDSGFNKLLFAPFSLFLASGYEKETENGFQRSVQVAGFPGWESWDDRAGEGEVNALVADRFLVELKGRNLRDSKVLHELASRSRYEKLAELK